jgi:adenine-specific DNA-methyltransferase
MALIDALVGKITDRSLRKALRKEVDLLLEKQKYGLVFQQHKPETVELYSHKVRRNCKVRIRSEYSDDLYRVESVKAGKATITATTDLHESQIIALDDLVVVREFGDAIYPGLERTGTVPNGGDKPPHLVINSENFHALELLLYTHLGKIDAIYIDPPYNTRDRDWKYNNNYVDSDDIYRDSKWLAMMERRLKLASQLLKPENSVLIVTIDENEVHRLGLLLEQTFRDATIQMVSVAINPAAVARGSEFRRADEYYFFVMLGDAAPQSVPLGGDWVTAKGRTHRGAIRWDLLRRSAEASARADRPGMFFPIFLTKKGTVHSIGDAIPLSKARTSVKPPAGTVAVWPIRKNGTEGRWRLGPETTREVHAKGYMRIGAFKGETTPIYYLTVGEQKKIKDGIYVISGQAADGAVITSTLDSDERSVIPSTQWRVASHDSTQYGSRMLLQLMPDRRFPYPKSLYAVEDALRFFVNDKPEAVILDFFAGSGTTMHAVARLNHRDDGRRQSICVTNNEVSDAEAVALRAQGFKPGDDEWEEQGICSLITEPRVRAIITGETPAGDPLPGDYKFIDEFPMAEGLDENAEFFRLTYEDRDQIERRRRFEALAPILWLTAGGRGVRIEKPEADWALPDGAVYGVLFNDDKWRDFVDAVLARGETVTHIFAVTESTSTFQQMLTELPRRITSTPLYSHYLQTFEENTKGRS